jgi:hypothetical protein
MSKRLVYIAGPYSPRPNDPNPLAAIQRNVTVAEEVAKMVLLQGNIPVIPHKITQYWDYDNRFIEKPHDYWLEEFALPLLARCDAIVFCEGWEKSEGHYV